MDGDIYVFVVVNQQETQTLKTIPQCVYNGKIIIVMGVGKRKGVSQNVLLKLPCFGFYNAQNFSASTHHCALFQFTGHLL